MRADGDHKRILRFHQSTTAHWLWDNQTLSNPHRECSVCSTDPFQCDLLCRPRYTVVSYASAHTRCSQTFPSKWEGLLFSRSEHEREEHGLQRGIAHNSLVFIRQTLINSNFKVIVHPAGRTVQLHGPKIVSTEKPSISKIKQISRWVAIEATHDRESVNMWRRLARERRESIVIPTFLDHTNDSIHLALKQ